MKVALVHDYIKEYGGAERVLEALHDIWPNSDVYTIVYYPEFLGPHRKRFEGWKIHTSIIQKIPFGYKLISPIRLLTPWIFENWNFNSYDLVFVSATSAYFPNLIVRKPKVKHITYCHTPPRFLYGYPTARNWQKHLLGRMAGMIANNFLRDYDYVSYQRPDHIIANSIEVKDRIWKFYKRKATVIYPPIDIGEKRKAKSEKKTIEPVLSFTLDAGSYYLAGGRLARAKRIDLAIEACNRLNLPLIVFGRGFADYDEELRKLAGPTIEFVGEVDDRTLSKLYLGAKALLYPSEHEDFGMIPVEAQSHGLPVIGLNQGGVKETVVDGKTGVLFEEPTVESIVKAIKRLSNITIKRQDCLDNAIRFNKDRFKREIKDFIKHRT